MGGAIGSALALPPASTLREWIEEMKTAPRGPFEGIRWFCEDGSVRPARAGCSGHGGGFQHGEWTPRVKEMRDGGYRIANFFVDMDGFEFTGAGANLSDLKQILLERFLVGFDEGWILRVVSTYRGAMQAEDEESGARRVIAEMMRDPRWQTDERFFLLKEVVRLFPASREDQDVTADEVRQRAMWIGNRDRAFVPLRTKIHNIPDSGDAERVREYAAERGRPQLEDSYAILADDIERLYGGRFAAKDAKRLAATLPTSATSNLREAITNRADDLRAAQDPFERLKLAGQLSALYRKYAREFESPDQRHALMVASIGAEEEMYLSGNELVAGLDRASRGDRLAWIRGAIDGLYGTGLISDRHAIGVRQAIQKLQEAKQPTLSEYRDELRYIGRAPEWANATILANFGDTVNHFAPIEPVARMYPQDRLRGSPFLFYGAVLDSLLKDADQKAGVQHELFGVTVHSGLRALNPGLARGVIRIPRDPEHPGRLDRDGIYLLPETIADLPPVAGILTEGEGSSLSHIQLLARNLGIPNVVVGASHLETIRAHEGDRVVLAVSPGGSVRIGEDGSQWDAAFGEKSAAPTVMIRPDLEELDLEETELLTLDDLRSRDSGRVVGPKAANLGELRRYFGEKVPPGFAIPFGVFRNFLDQRIEPGGPTVFEWMKGRYREIAALRDEPRAKERAERAFLAQIRKWIETTDPGLEFRTAVTAALRENFGPDGTYGVFVRSDTNVEDLPGFTGAGLNLTVPNVVGEAAILTAIQKVWASPFTERSYAWRQSHMSQPEYVFPSVLVQKAFPSEKSGVMVTSDVEGGGDRYLTVAVNEGVGGAVDGQSAESLRVDRSSGNVRILAQAGAKTRRVLVPTGGLREVPTSGGDRILQQSEIRQLIELAEEVEDFPALRNEDGDVVPADVEFGFRSGELALLQIRPFNESASARRSGFLTGLDGRKGQRATGRVPLGELPGGGR